VLRVRPFAFAAFVSAASTDFCTFVVIGIVRGSGGGGRVVDFFIYGGLIKRCTSLTSTTLGTSREDFFQLSFELPKSRFLHTPSFAGLHYSDDLIIFEVSFI
jgi:hypothetical protein